MNFVNFQKELFERKLKLQEYFKRAFQVLWVFIMENKLWITSFVLINILLSFPIMSEFLLLEVLTSYYNIFFHYVVYTKTIYKIENRESEFKIGSIIIKSLKLFGVCVLFVPVIVISFALIRRLLDFFSTDIILKMEIIRWIMTIMTLVCLPYFIQIYFTRNMKIWKSFKYNLELAKTNRMRIAVPILILNVLSRIFPILLNNRFENFYINIPINIAGATIESFFMILMVVMYVVVFLNVEYDYLKKQNL